MKRLLITVFALLLSIICIAQQQVAKVTLKNGTVLTGQVSELDPISHVKLIVGGFETKISMSDVASIENVKDENAIEQKNEQGQTAAAAEAHDYDGLPDIYNLKVGPYVIEMKLVKGAHFMMGYDGAGSMRMNSEPVHEVALSSYYINLRPLNKDVVGFLKKGKEEHSRADSVYRPFSRNDAKGIAEKISEVSKLPVDLITEAQWEYAAAILDGIFEMSESEWNYCYDHYGNYPISKSIQVDPKGPKSGVGYVLRKFSQSESIIYSRESSLETGASANKAIRITFSAKAIK